MLPGEELYIEAFWALRTEARSSNLTLGRVPWSKAMAYARDELGWSPHMQRGFWIVIEALDAAFLKWKKNEYETYQRAQSRAGKAKPSKGKRGGIFRRRRR